jgi:hypothetical protein
MTGKGIAVLQMRLNMLQFPLEPFHIKLDVNHCQLEPVQATREVN